MQYFLEGESKYNSKKVINNKTHTHTMSSETSTPKLREHVPFSAFVVHFSSCLCVNIFKVPKRLGWGMVALPKPGVRGPSWRGQEPPEISNS